MVERIAGRYAQLCLTPAEGMSRSERYRRITKEGEPYEGRLDHFRTSPQDRYAVAKTPAGAVEVLNFGLREDFVTAVRILRDRCEPTAVPETEDAVLITGLTDWGKIRAHEKAYRATGCTDWEKERRRFLQDRDACTSPLLLTCEGPLRGIPAEKAGLAEEKWAKISAPIRRYGMLTRFVTERKWGALENPGWDPILRDCIGIFAALRSYDDVLAKKILPFPSEAAERAVDALQEAVCCWGGTDPFRLLHYIYQQTDLYETPV